MTADLVAFLRACYDEDERVVSTGRRHNDHGAYAKDNYGCLLVDPARVLADIESMRRIVALHARHETEVLTADDEENVTLCRECANDWPCATIRHLAQPYADRPGFDPAWLCDDIAPVVGDPPPRPVEVFDWNLPEVSEQDVLGVIVQHRWKGPDAQAAAISEAFRSMIRSWHRELGRESPPMAD